MYQPKLLDRYPMYVQHLHLGLEIHSFPPVLILNLFLSGAAARLDRHLAEALIWFGCRHHTAERHMAWADDAVRHAQQPGGEDPLFKRFQTFFDYLDLDDLKMWEGDPRGNDTWLSQQAEIARTFAENVNASKSWIREDYQEMAELLIVYFEGVVRRRGADGTPYHHDWHMERPGAVSTARFIGRALYFMKIEMTKHQIPESVVSNAEKDQIGRISKFTFFIYGKYFLQTMVPVAAPKYDLEFWTDTHQFRDCDPELVESVLISLNRHLWYVSE